jgi:hypothetical protein
MHTSASVRPRQHTQCSGAGAGANKTYGVLGVRVHYVQPLHQQVLDPHEPKQRHLQSTIKTAAPSTHASGGGRPRVGWARTVARRTSTGPEPPAAVVAASGRGPSPTSTGAAATGALLAGWSTDASEGSNWRSGGTCSRRLRINSRICRSCTAAGRVAPTLSSVGATGEALSATAAVADGSGALAWPSTGTALVGACTTSTLGSPCSYRHTHMHTHT